MKTRVDNAFKKTFGCDPEKKESEQDNTSKNGNVFEDSHLLCVYQNLLIKS